MYYIHYNTYFCARWSKLATTVHGGETVHGSENVHGGENGCKSVLYGRPTVCVCTVVKIGYHCALDYVLYSV